MVFQQADYCFIDTKTEDEVEFVQKVVKCIRSARSDYNIPNKNKSIGNSSFLHNRFCKKPLLYLNIFV